MTSSCPAPPDTTWPTTRILFVLAGTVTVLSAVLAVTFSPWFLLLTGFVGVNQLLFAAVGACPVSLIIDRVIRPARAVGSSIT